MLRSNLAESSLNILQKEMAALKEKHQKLQQQKIALEQKNDDFERDLR